MLVDALGSKVVGPATHGDDQLVIRQAAARNQLTAIGGMNGRQQNLAGLAVQAAHLSGLVGKLRIAGLRQIRGLLLGQITRARRNGVQHGLPDMGRVAVHQHHAFYAIAAQLAQRRGHLQPGHSAAHHHNACRMRGRMGCMGFRRCRSYLNITGMGVIDDVFHESLPAWLPEGLHAVPRTRNSRGYFPIFLSI